MFSSSINSINLIEIVCMIYTDNVEQNKERKKERNINKQYIVFINL